MCSTLITMHTSRYTPVTTQGCHAFILLTNPTKDESIDETLTKASTYQKKMVRYTSCKNVCFIDEKKDKVNRTVISMYQHNRANGVMILSRRNIKQQQYSKYWIVKYAHS